MSKKELAKTTGGTTALAQPSEYARPYQMMGRDEEDQILPRVILHQGKMSKKFHGDHEEGTLLNSVTGEVIDARKFTPVGVAWKEWIRFGENIGDPIQYKTRNKADVPPEDLRWNGDDPPACDLIYNFVVLFEGHEMPLVLSLKAASKRQKAAALALNQMEEMRAGKKAAPGFYRLDVVDDSNDKGEWKTFKIAPAGEPPTELAGLAYQFWQALAGRTVEAHDAERGATDGDYDPDQDA